MPWPIKCEVRTPADPRARCFASELKNTIQDDFAPPTRTMQTMRMLTANALHLGQSSEVITLCWFHDWTRRLLTLLTLNVARFPHRGHLAPCPRSAANWLRGGLDEREEVPGLPPPPVVALRYHPAVRSWLSASRFCARCPPSSRRALRDGRGTCGRSLPYCRVSGRRLQ